MGWWFEAFGAPRVLAWRSLGIARTAQRFHGGLGVASRGPHECLGGALVASLAHDGPLVRPGMGSSMAFLGGCPPFKAALWRHMLEPRVVPGATLGAAWTVSASSLSDLKGNSGSVAARGGGCKCATVDAHAALRAAALPRTVALLGRRCGAPW